MVGMDCNLSHPNNEVEESGVSHRFQTEEELLQSMGYKQVNTNATLKLR